MKTETKVTEETETEGIRKMETAAGKDRKKVIITAVCPVIISAVIILLLSSHFAVMGIADKNNILLFLRRFAFCPFIFGFFLFGDKGVEAKSHMSTIEDDAVKMVKEAFGTKKAQEPEKKEGSKPEAAKAEVKGKDMKTVKPPLTTFLPFAAIESKDNTLSGLFI